jgi:hypothetical protein
MTPVKTSITIWEMSAIKLASLPHVVQLDLAAHAVSEAAQVIKTSPLCIYEDPENMTEEELNEFRENLVKLRADIGNLIGLRTMLRQLQGAGV